MHTGPIHQMSKPFIPKFAEAPALGKITLFIEPPRVVIPDPGPAL